MERYDCKFYDDRGLKLETRRKFQIGYRFDTGEFDFDYKDFVINSLQNLRGGQTRFLNSVLIPILDLWGDIKGIYSRCVAPVIIQKHDSTRYEKNNILYGLNITGEEILKKGFAVIVEGAMDAVILYQEGFKNVVATLGTSLSFNQLVQLSFFTDTLLIMYDGDKAGWDKMFDLYGKYNREMNIQFCILPQGWDPDDFVRKYKNEVNSRIFTYEELLDNQIKEKLRF